MNDTTATTEELRRALAAEEGGRRWLRRIAIAGGIAAIVGAGVVWRVKHRPPPPAKYVTKTVEVGDVVEKVQATGAVQPLLQVNVGAQVNGRVTDVFVDFNSPVKKGQVLAIIDPSILGTQVSAQEAQLLGQRASLQQYRAQMESSRAQMNTSKTALDRTRALYNSSLAGSQGRPRCRPRGLRRRGRDLPGCRRRDRRSAGRDLVATGAVEADDDEPRVHEDLSRRSTASS